MTKFEEDKLMILRKLKRIVVEHVINCDHSMEFQDDMCQVVYLVEGLNQHE